VTTVRKQTLAEELTATAQGSLKVSRKCELGQTKVWFSSLNQPLGPLD